MAGLNKSSTSGTTRGKPTHVTSSNSSASHNDASSSIPTMSKSASMARGAGFVLPNGRSSLEDEHEEEEDDSSKPSKIRCRGDASTTVTSKEDKTTVNLVVTEQVFPKVKFVDKDTQLMFSSEQKSICQFVIGLCNLHTDISQPHWWKPAQKYVSQTINRLRNDRNTAMKWATLGKLQCWQREVG